MSYSGTQIILLIKATFIIIFAIYIFYTLSNRKKIDLFSPLYIFPLAYIFYLYSGSLDIIQDTYTITAKQWTFYLCGLFCFYAGALIPFFKEKTAGQKTPGYDKPWEKNRLIFILSMIFLAVVVTRLFIYSKVGIPLLSSDVNLARLEAFKSGYLGEISISTEVVFMAAFAGLLIYKKNRFPFYVLLVICLVFALLTGTRTSLIRQIFPCIILYHYLHKKISIRTFTIIIMIALIFIGSMSFFRVYKMWGSLEVESLREQNYSPLGFWLFYVFRDFKHGPEGFARILEVIPGKFNYQFGRLHILPFLMPLPGHTPQPGVVFKDMVGAEFTGVGLAATLLAPQYADFGIAGILLGMFLVGVIFEYTYLLARKKNHHFYYLVYGAIFITLILGIRTNYLNFEIIWTIFLLTLIHFLVGKKTTISSENKNE
jgi:oligosaccharide repeat unit polymerase